MNPVCMTAGGTGAKKVEDAARVVVETYEPTCFVCVVCVVCGVLVAVDVATTDTGIGVIAIGKRGERSCCIVDSHASMPA